MLNKIKKIIHPDGCMGIFKRPKEVVTNTGKVITSVAKEEIAEIKDLNLTEVDKLQGDVIANVAVAVMASMGIPCSLTMKEIIKTSAAYAIRDFKEGYTNPEKLIVTRVINKIHEIKEARAQ